MWTNTPMCHIVPMDWSQWSIGEEVNVMVYSNASYVKMYLNGELVGTYNNKNISNATSKGSFYGTIPFQKGRLVANAYDTNDNLIAQDVIYTADIANKLSLKSEKLYYKDSELDHYSYPLCFLHRHLLDILRNNPLIFSFLPPVD